jgi:hypothetical protein
MDPDLLALPFYLEDRGDTFLSYEGFLLTKYMAL